MHFTVIDVAFALLLTQQMQHMPRNSIEVTFTTFVLLPTFVKDIIIISEADSHISFAT